MISFIPEAPGLLATLVSDEGMPELLRFVARHGIPKPEYTPRMMLGAVPTILLSPRGVSRMRGAAGSLPTNSWGKLLGVSLELWSRRWMSRHVIKYPRKFQRP